MRPSPKLIAFSGVDCAGKSTQIARLEASLKAAGHRVTTFWYRPGYSQELDWLRASVRQVVPKLLPRTMPGQHSSAEPSTDERLPTPEPTRAKSRRDRAFSNPLVRETWIQMSLVDTFVQWGLKLRALRYRGHTVICDRYWVDAMLDLKFKFAEQNVPDRLPTKALFLALPKPDRHFVLTLPHAEMVERARAKNEPFPDPDHIRDARFEAYQELARQSPYHWVRGERSMVDVHSEIAAIVGVEPVDDSTSRSATLGATTGEPGRTSR